MVGVHVQKTSKVVLVLDPRAQSRPHVSVLNAIFPSIHDSARSGIDFRWRPPESGTARVISKG